MTGDRENVDSVASQSSTQNTNHSLVGRLSVIIPNIGLLLKDWTCPGNLADAVLDLKTLPSFLSFIVSFDIYWNQTRFIRLWESNSMPTLKHNTMKVIYIVYVHVYIAYTVPHMYCIYHFPWISAAV